MGQNYRLVAFQANSSHFPKLNLLPQYWQNGNTEEKGKLLNLELQYLENGKT